MKLLGLLQNNERMLIDACEFLNAIYEDMAGINDLFSLKEAPCLTVEGTVLFYKGYQIVNTCEPRMLAAVL